MVYLGVELRRTDEALEIRLFFKDRGRTRIELLKFPRETPFARALEEAAKRKEELMGHAHQ